MSADTVEKKRPSSRGAPPKPDLEGGAVTPMMAQYFEKKREAGDALLFYRMGDFYELFFNDAVIAAEALDIALTQRGKHQGDDIPMCGVPAATADTYLSRLIAKGFRVAVCEQTEDPKEAKKRGAKSVVARDIVRVVTPGTITEDALLDARAAAWILAIAPAKAGKNGAAPMLGLAWADVTTGAFHVCDAASDTLAERVAALSPREVLACDAAWEGLADETLQAALDRAEAALTLLPAPKFHAKAARARLRRAYDVQTLDGFGAFSDGEIAAAGAVLDYVELTQAGAPARLAPPTHAAAGAVMAIDPATRASLEIERTLSGARQGALLQCVDRTQTPAGARLLAQRLAEPLTDVAAIAARQDAVAFLRRDSGLRADVRARLKAAGDPARALSRLSLGRGGPRDLATLAGALRAGSEVAGAVLAGEDPPTELARAAQALAFSDQPTLAKLCADVGAALVEAPPLLTREGGFVRPGADAALDAARALRDDSRRVIAGLEARYRDDTGLNALKIKHNNVLGYFVEVTARHGERLMSAPHDQLFTHRQTMANAVRFSTVELAELERRITEAASEALTRELALFDALTARAVAAADAVRAAAGALAVVDVAAAAALWAEEVDAVRPVVDDGSGFEVEAGRHPVVEAVLRAAGEAFAPNDCALDAAGAASQTGKPRLAFVTGPNMAGKSTYLRQNAVIAILAQAGWCAPAKRVRIGVVDRLFSRVGAADDLARGRSTFMAEMVETAAILNQAGPRAFVILDEIGRGTATYDGLAIAWATAEHLHDVNACRAMFATHYHELTRLTDTLHGAANLHLRAKAWEGGLVFLHEVASGAADRSYGVEVARRAGLPGAAVARAQDVLERLEGRAQAGGADLGGIGDALADLPLFQASAVMRPGPQAQRPEDHTPPDLVGYNDGAGPDYGPGVDEGARGSTAAETPPEHPVLTELAALNPDEMSPREALEALYRLREALRSFARRP